MAGKGDAPRPLSVSEEEFGKQFDAIDWSATREAREAWAELERIIADEEEE